MAKRLVKDNTGPARSINNNEVTRALLQYLNTPLRGVTESPAQILFGRPISIGLPAGLLKKGWTSQNHHKELGLAKIKAEVKERLDRHAKTTQPPYR